MVEVRVGIGKGVEVERGVGFGVIGTWILYVAGFLERVY